MFSCLSHDVVAHETTHALLDGLHRYYQLDTNPDIAAFHEAFADIVALFQHFTIPDALKHTIARTRGELRRRTFWPTWRNSSDRPPAVRARCAAHSVRPPKATDYEEATEAHDRGAVLLSAIFQAFLEIYDARIMDLRRLATGGTGVLPPGDIPIDLVNRMAAEASTTASHVLTACIRALDYCPPVDLTFGDYLRALITADMDLEPEDELNYRTAFISGFRARGIFPDGVRNLSEENLRWQPPNFTFEPERIRDMLSSLDITWNLAEQPQEVLCARRVERIQALELAAAESHVRGGGSAGSRPGRISRRPAKPCRRASRCGRMELRCSRSTLSARRAASAAAASR